MENDKEKVKKNYKWIIINIICFIIHVISWTIGYIYIKKICYIKLGGKYVKK